ncbi:MAG: ABC transporter ATP-binding protein [Firmicutes bacterium]|nr:ABC transporter ATP-binding protein [Bacillota bacterium]
MIKAKNLIKRYESSGVVVINDVSLEFESGEFVSIMGRSGSGKSTLLKLLSGLLLPCKGEVECAGFNVTMLKGRELTHFRTSVIGIVFQENNLIEDFSIKDNILTPLYIVGKKVDKEYFDKLIEITALKNFLSRKPKSLSGGEKQRASIARALISKPQILFADEPTGSLDSKSEQQIMELFKKINKEFATTIIQVTHSEVCASLSKRIVRMKDGKVE